MRFYLKLVVVASVLVAGNQWLNQDTRVIRESIFAIRCWIAWNTGNEPMQERLINEARQEARAEMDAMFERYLARHPELRQDISLAPPAPVAITSGAALGLTQREIWKDEYSTRR